MELAGDAARRDQKVRITPRHVQIAVRNDEEIDKLVGTSVVPGGGVVPNIHPALEHKENKQRIEALDETQ